jgi:transcriptional regulator with XRE-family HTH domain
MRYKRIRSLREEAELTQTQMSHVIHCSQQAYSKYELGDREIPLEKLIILAQFFHTSTDYILDLSDKRDVYRYGKKRKKQIKHATTQSHRIVKAIV